MDRFRFVLPSSVIIYWPWLVTEPLWSPNYCWRKEYSMVYSQGWGSEANVKCPVLLAVHKLAGCIFPVLITNIQVPLSYPFFTYSLCSALVYRTWQSRYAVVLFELTTQLKRELHYVPSMVFGLRYLLNT